LTGVGETRPMFVNVAGFVVAMHRTFAEQAVTITGDYKDASVF